MLVHLAMQRKLMSPNMLQKGRFKGMAFTRVIKNFVIQGGDINKLGSTEDWTSRGKHYNHLDTRLKHEAFMLGTSKTKLDGGGFDLFITTAPIPDLSEKINVFWRVIKGEDIVQDQYIVAPREKQQVEEENGTNDEDNTQDLVEDKHQLGRIKDWISSYHLDTVELTDILSNFPDVSVHPSLVNMCL
ncbi:hypothetical protein ACS0TY_017348 [Phlomoides rotata]